MLPGKRRAAEHPFPTECWSRLLDHETSEIGQAT